MRQMRIPAILAVGCLLMAGCGEFSYKRGAGTGDLGSAQKACKSRGGDGAAYEKCMSERGWVVQQLDELSPVATIVSNQDNRISALDQATPETEGTSTVDVSTKQAPPSPLDAYTISSWWKAGGKPEGLKLAVDACVEKLGEAHRPPSGSSQATRGLLLCLREQGWHGLQGK